MMQFDTIYTKDVMGLGHWCKGLDERDRSNQAAYDAQAKRKEYERRYKNLKNSPEQHEIQQFERLIKAKKLEIKRLQKEKEQMQQMAEVQGLGIFCRDADREAEEARRNLIEQERLLGEAKERYENLMRRHKEYLPLLRKQVEVLDNKIMLLKREIKGISARIEEKKRIEMQREQMERMRKEKEAGEIERLKAQKQANSILGVDENTLILLIGATLAGYIIIK